MPLFVSLHVAWRRLLSAHLIPDLSRDILQLRRREKDYLLRDDKRYINMALQELQGMKNQIETSGISADDKIRLLGLLANYEKDFLALVEQNDHIVTARCGDAGSYFPDLPTGRRTTWNRQPGSGTK